MAKKILKYRTTAICKDMYTFRAFVIACHESRNYSGPSIYFHVKAIEKYRLTDNYRSLLSDDQYIEYIYAAVACWGMHRMTKNVLMKEYRDFKRGIQAVRGYLMGLRKYQLETIRSIESIRDPLLLAFTNLDVMEKGTKIIGNSKILHHLLPDLVPPMDRRNTMNFFYEDPLKKQVSIPKDEDNCFLEILGEYVDIATRLELSLRNFRDRNPFDTSVPKIIDNAVIGFIQKEGGRARR